MCSSRDTENHVPMPNCTLSFGFAYILGSSQINSMFIHTLSDHPDSDSCSDSPGFASFGVQITSTFLHAHPFLVSFAYTYSTSPQFELTFSLDTIGFTHSHLDSLRLIQVYSDWFDAVWISLDLLHSDPK